LIGALYIDCGGDLSIVHPVLFGHMLPVQIQYNDIRLWPRPLPLHIYDHDGGDHDATATDDHNDDTTNGIPSSQSLLSKSPSPPSANKDNDIIRAAVSSLSLPPSLSAAKVIPSMYPIPHANETNGIYTSDAVATATTVKDDDSKRQSKQITAIDTNVSSSSSSVMSSSDLWLKPCGVTARALKVNQWPPDVQHLTSSYHGLI
jgi:hypothetical protein